VSDEDDAVAGIADADGAARSTGIIARLYVALDQKMREIETRIERASQAGSDECSAADCERDARTLTTLAKLYEKICEMEGTSDPSASDKRISQEAMESDADRFREEIANRLTRMLEAEED